MKAYLNYWTMSSLGQNVKFLSGGTPSKTKEEYWNGNISWVSSGSMSENRIYETDLKITQEGLNAGSRLVNKNTSFVVVRGMSLAKEFRVSLAMREMAFNQDIKAVVPLRDNLDLIFLFYYLVSQAQPIRDSASEAAHGTKKLDMAVLEQWPLPIPPLETQKKIAAILSAYDDLIETNKQRIALLEKMAEEIYREWFVRFRFPGWQNTEFEKGIPKGWEMEKIDQAFHYLGGGTPSKDNPRYWDEGDINWFTPSDITGSSSIFLSESGIKCNQEGLENSSAKIFPAYSIMMTSRATIGAIGINTTPACTNQGFISCIPNQDYPITYLYHWLKLSKPYFELISTGATFQELTKGVFKKIQILKPSNNILRNFHGLINPIFTQIEALHTASQNLNQTKSALLPRLISGKLSVENLDIEFPPSLQ